MGYFFRTSNPCIRIAIGPGFSFIRKDEYEKFILHYHFASDRGRKEMAN